MLQQKASKFVVKDSNDDSRTISGYASVFGNRDSDNDVIEKGAFKRTIKAWGPEGKDRIKLMSQHDMSRPVARITELKEDDKGLYIEAKFGTHTDGEDHYRMVKEGLLNEFSVGFVSEQKSENEKGGFDITEIKLYEVSLVSVAANDEAIVTEVKSQDISGLIKQVENDELGFKIEKEFLRLQTEILTKDSTPTSSEEESDAEVVEKSDNFDWDAFAEHLNN